MAVSKNTQKIISFLDRNASRRLTINQIAKTLSISVGSAHKILKELEDESVVKAESLGNAIFYVLNHESATTKEILAEIGSTRQIMIKKTKIIATIGPVTNSIEEITKLKNAGMDVARINSSHGNPEQHSDIIKKVREVDATIPILLDIPGPKVRVRGLKEPRILKANSTIILSTTPEGDAIGVDLPEFPKHVKPRQELLMDDGSIAITVQSIDGNNVTCLVQHDAVLQEGKGVNIPGAILSRESIQEKENKCIAFAKKEQVDFVGLSFVNTADEVRTVEKKLEGSTIKIIAKVENQEAIKNVSGIIEAAYGIMIDRGDLGSEVSFQKVPMLQKHIIEEGNKRAKPVIVATEMLHSMVTQPLPKKSEVADIASAVMDGASAVMLSGETAIGANPEQAVKVMSTVIQECEEETPILDLENDNESTDPSDACSKMIIDLSKHTHIDKLLCITHGGFSARMLARFNSSFPIIALTSNIKIVRRLKLLRGVIPLQVEHEIDNSGSVEQKKEAIMACIKNQLIEEQDTIVLAGAVFPNHRKIINMVEVHKVDEFLGFFKQHGGTNESK
jgi:pyruvate kinase